MSERAFKGCTWLFGSAYARSSNGSYYFRQKLYLNTTGHIHASAVIKTVFLPRELCGIIRNARLNLFICRGVRRGMYGRTREWNPSTPNSKHCGSYHYVAD